ncbi:MAG: FliA/WhiG family RNA polymerase sigma factor, partial [Kiritimatiellaeota bacterium]|nr:FliA/WhiG family RNA polymerase sigma factor [Kiritimatiellota bacterium]
MKDVMANAESDSLCDSSQEERFTNKPRVMRLVGKLKRNDRLILLLYYYHDMTIEDIATTLDLSEDRVRQFLSNVMLRLQRTLSERQSELVD